MEGARMAEEGQNKDLWLQLDEIAGKHEITWHCVRGHSGAEGNERCDMLSLEAAQKIEASHTQQQRDEALNQFLKNRSAVPDQSKPLADDSELL